MSKADWEAIRREYETDGVSARKLAEKYGVSHTAINQRAKAEGWRKPAKLALEKQVSAKKMEAKKVEKRKVETGKFITPTDERVSKPVIEKLSREEIFQSFNPSD